MKIQKILEKFKEKQKDIKKLDKDNITLLPEEELENNSIALEKIDMNIRRMIKIMIKIILGDILDSF